MRHAVRCESKFLIDTWLVLLGSWLRIPHDTHVIDGKLHTPDLRFSSFDFLHRRPHGARNAKRSPRAFDGDSDDDALDGDSDDDALDGDSDDNARSTGSPSRNFRNMSFAGQSWKHPRALQVHGGIHGTKSFFVIYDESNGDAPDANAHFFRATGLDMVARPGHDTPIACQVIRDLAVLISQSNPRLRRLHLGNGRITANAAKALAHALTPSEQCARNGSLNTLELTVMKICPEGIKALGTALTPNEQGIFNGSLTSLNLRGTHLGTEGFETLAAALTPNEQGIFNGSLTALNLNYTNIGDEGAKALAAALTPNEQGVFNGSLSMLDLGNTGGNAPRSLVDAIAAHPEQWISFNGIPVRDLKRNRLSELDLTKNEIGTAGVMVLAKLVALSGSLITLILSESHLGGSYHDDVAEGFEALGMALKENKSLTALKLDRTEMRSKGAAAFASGLAFNTSLITLDLSGNKIGPIGAKALATALAPNEQGVVNRPLRSLNVRNSGLGFEGARALADAVKRHSAPIKLCDNLLDVQDCELSDRYAWYRPEDTALLASDLVFNTLLKTLSLAGREIGPEGGKALAAALTPNERGAFNGTLTALDLSGTGLCGRDTVLSAFFREAHDSSCAQALTQALKFNTSLNTLDVSGNCIHGQAAHQLARVVLDHPTLTVFNGIPLQQMRDDALGSLVLKSRHIGIPGVVVLSRLLTFNKSLHMLDLSAGNGLCPYRIGNDYDLSGIKALAKAMVVNKSLNTLNMWGNDARENLCADAARAVIAAVKQRGVSVKLCGDMLDVRELHLKSCGSRGVQPVAVILLANDLTFNGSLHTLDISGSDFCERSTVVGVEALEALGMALKANTTLAVLNLSRSHVGPKGAAALSSSLGVSRSLTTLDLSGNMLCGLWQQFGEFHGEYDPSGIAALSEALGLNKSLNTVDIKDNHVGGHRGAPEALEALGKTISFGASLGSLDLSGNAIGPADAIALVAGGVLNGALNTLNLQGNLLCGVRRYTGGTYDSSAITAIAKALTFNKSLKILNLADNNIRRDGAEALAVALTPNEQGVFNKALETLIVSKRGYDCAELPIGALRRNSITELDLRGKGLWPEDAILLAAALVFNKSLKSLNLAGNDLGGLRFVNSSEDLSGVKALADALVRNLSLSALNLAGNKLCGVDDYRMGTYDPSGVTAFAKTLALNNSLSTLDLRGNYLREDAQRAVREAVATPSFELVL
ncbi:hypothetical protein CYMTET_13956 [Cymbomonas tetramitiformis]|uniref:Uncharacterized protein n=1 Tax=Cymbomonas tetramitiformis TaxID=36881 RepID=A0AAE0GHB6_9CHLO|nr:hypothetical protein CYMTET_13956 [Cymbomonas tetramitiformis]